MDNFLLRPCSLVLLDRVGTPIKVPDLHVILEFLNDTGGVDRRSDFAFEMLADHGVTEHQARTVAKILEPDFFLDSDFDAFVENELTIEIDDSGNIYSMIDGHDILKTCDGWSVDSRLVDDLRTAVKICLDDRKARVGEHE